MIKLRISIASVTIYHNLVETKFKKSVIHKIEMFWPTKRKKNMKIAGSVDNVYMCVSNSLQVHSIASGRNWKGHYESPAHTQTHVCIVSTQPWKHTILHRFIAYSHTYLYIRTIYTHTYLHFFTSLENSYIRMHMYVFVIVYVIIIVDMCWIMFYILSWVELS